jgi:uncharacterized protein (TIGR02284 family)
LEKRFENPVFPYKNHEIMKAHQLILALNRLVTVNANVEKSFRRYAQFASSDTAKQYFTQQALYHREFKLELKALVQQFGQEIETGNNVIDDLYHGFMAAQTQLLKPSDPDLLRQAQRSVAKMLKKTNTFLTSMPDLPEFLHHVLENQMRLASEHARQTGFALYN